MVVSGAVVSGCEIYGNVENSVVSHNVEIGEGATVKNSIIFSDVVIESGAMVINSIVAEDVKICKNATVGAETEDNKITVIGGGVTISNDKVVPAGEILENNV